jgi:hypothetical protein
VVWRLGNATLDGGLFLWFSNAYEAVLHAAEAERICADGPDARHCEVIGWVSSESQPYHERYVLLRCFMQSCGP